MQVELPIQSKNACGLSYLPFIQFCAGDPHLGKDSCNVSLFHFKYEKPIKFIRGLILKRVTAEAP
jgi:hypothetical protein